MCMAEKKLQNEQQSEKAHFFTDQQHSEKYATFH